MKLLMLVAALQITGPQVEAWQLPNASTTGSVEFAQCRFRSGARLLLFRPGRRRHYEMFFVEGDRVDPSEINVLPGNRLDIETNGGVASLNAVGASFRDLRKRRFARIPAAELRLRLRDQRVPRCRRPYKDGTR